MCQTSKKIEKYTEAMARAIAKEEGIHWGDASLILRLCTYCGAWVRVDDYSSEREIGEETHLDICDDCSGRIAAGEEVERFKDEEIDPDDYCSDCGHPLDDPLNEEYCANCRPYYPNEEDEECMY
ncbi:hypothetical protein [Aneurinibacillus thermoaerophilus]|uniref:hypothetical protein n=1 Tax=Aneurinibacillus thermoaerophilus TaxID=143495 RepID=UPI002E225482|nr:hypothetical protein [Aneurinibacillus thermoaerophilus]